MRLRYGRAKALSGTTPTTPTLTAQTLVIFLLAPEQRRIRKKLEAIGNGAARDETTCVNQKRLKAQITRCKWWSAS
jgi:hypothetical protein